MTVAYVKVTKKKDGWMWRQCTPHSVFVLFPFHPLIKRLPWILALTLLHQLSYIPNPAFILLINNVLCKSD